MTDEKKYDDEETQKFYEDNKEMIEKILAGRKQDEEESEKAYLEEMLRRAAFERRVRMEYEAERARRQAFEGADRAYSDFKYGRDRTESAFEESRDHFRDYSRRQGDYIYDMLTEEMDHLRETARRGRQYARDRYEEDHDMFRESRDRARQRFNEGFDDVFGPFTDSRFQKHMFGAGIELWMALNALIKSGAFPDSIKNAFSSAEFNKNAEFCSKNQNCRNRPVDDSGDSSPSEPRQIKITPIRKESD